MGWEDRAQQVKVEGVVPPVPEWQQRAEPVDTSPEPDLAYMGQQFKDNLQRKAEAEAATKTVNPKAETEPTAPEVGPQVTEAKSFIDALEAGWDLSVTGLITGGAPDVVMPEHAPRFYKIASQVATLAGDVPAMIAGGFAGGVSGAAAGTATLPVVGTVALGTVGAAAGAFALPEAIREGMMKSYELGEVNSFGDYWDVFAATTIGALKGGAIGAVTAGAGGKVASIVGKTALPAAVKTSATLATEVATMTTVGAALDGRVPEPDEFIDGAILLAGMHGAVKVSSKLRQVYAKSGTPPAEVLQAIANDPKTKQELLSENVEMPKALAPKGPKVEAPIAEPKPAPKEPNPDLPPEVNTILSKVGEKGEAPKKPFDARKVYTDFVDRLDPINEVTKLLTENADNLTADKNPYMLARTSVDAKSKAKHFFEKGTLDYNTLSNEGGSLKSILKGVESVETLEAYMISKRALEKNMQGKATGFDIAAAETVVKNNKAKYEAASKQITEFSNKALKYVKDAGLISDKQFNAMLESNKDYVPFKRIIEQSDVPGSKKGGGKAGSLKEFKGSTRDIQRPIQSIVENTVELIRMAEQNRPKVALLELAEKAEGQDIIVKVKQATQAIEVKAEEVARQLDIPIEQAESITAFRKMNRPLAENQFSVFRDGKMEVYETTPELAKAVKVLGGDGSSTNMVFKLARGLTTVKKIGITFTPDFILRNVFRDWLTSSTFSKSKGMSPFDIAGAMGDLIKKNDVYYEWLKSGGANGAFLEMGDRYVKTDIYKLQRETNFMNSARNLIEKPIDAMRVAAELSEQAIRLAEFKKVTKGKSGPKALLEGGFASREITIDFQRVGAKVSALNSITAFMNVSIQGLDRTVRAIKENPGEVTAKSLAYITAPSLLLWWANKDDPRYQEIPRWEKDMFWIIPTDNWKESSFEEAADLPDYMVRKENGKTFINKGSIYRLPKPQELGIMFGSMPERMMEQFFTDNPRALKDFEETMFNLVTPAFIPDAISPAVEQYFNKSLFTGRDIIPHHLQNVLPEYHFVEYTSETAKTLGKMVATVDKTNAMASPLTLDNYIRSWGGALGQYAVQVADKALQAAGIAPDTVDPTSTLSDIPFIKAFAVRFPRAGSASVQDFYDTYTENEKVINTIKYLAKQGDLDNLEKEFFLKANREKLVNLKGIKEGLANQSDFIRKIYRNPDLSPDEKRQMIDGIYLFMTEAAKNGNLIMDEIQKELRDGTKYNNQ